jgi:pimeloyl-ACP methyl ester carboxylesterase
MTRRAFLFLHGAAGHGAEWEETRTWLAELGDVETPDLPGHGARTALRPGSLDELVDDAAAVASKCPSPPLVIGQSLGGSIGIALAGRRPDAVSALVAVEASPTPDSEAAKIVSRWLEDWPVPFSSRREAESFFGGGRAGTAWAAGLVETTEGLVPGFDVANVGRIVRLVTSVDLWDEWRRIECPTLIVRGGRGHLQADEAARMASTNPNARVAVVEGAGHDVHLDDPRGFRTALERFLES